MRIITRGYGAGLATPHNVVIRGYGASAAPVVDVVGGSGPGVHRRRRDRDDPAIMAVIKAFLKGL